ncbi:MAG: phosphoglycerate kinase, partial [Alphaproteobacteria bacterium]|nr:phosphoglycerate kinase [Alphaproteobacteria bacterium]
MYHSILTMPKGYSTAFLRVDCNVPIQDGVIMDLTRIEKIIPTIELLATKVDRIVMATHLGRPSTRHQDGFSTDILLPALEKLLAKPVIKLDSFEAPIPQGHGIYIHENVRFHPGEESNDLSFAQTLARHCDVYINDAFSCSHRSHASIVGIPQFLPSYAGLLLHEELSTLKTLLSQPHHPVMAIVGGSKVSTKMQLLENLQKKVDYLVIGGAMANTFLKAQGIDIGQSLYEESFLPFCQEFLKTCKPGQMILPQDYIASDHLQSQNFSVCTPQEPCKGMILDFGPKSLQHLIGILQTCKTVLWNGPLGAYEYEPYDKGSRELAQAIAHNTRTHHLKSVAG